MYARIHRWSLHFWSDPVRADFLVMLLDRVLRMGVGLIITGLIARHLGPDLFGRLNYAGAVIAVGVTFAFLGLDSIAVRDAAKRPDQIAEIMGASLVMRLMAGVLTLLLVLIGLPVIAGEDPVQRELVLIVSLTALGPALGVFSLWFQAQTKVRYATIASWWVFFAVTGARVWLLANGGTVMGFAWLALAEIFGSGAIIWVVMMNQKGSFSVRGLSSHVPRMIRDGAPLMVGALAGVLYMRVDLIVLKWLGGSEIIGIYAAATRLSESAYAVAALWGASAMAKLSDEMDGPKKPSPVIMRYFRTTTALCYAIVIPLMLIAPWLLGKLFGKEYDEAGLIAQVHLLSAVFVGIGVARGRVLVIQGRPYFLMTTALIGCMVNFVMNIFLVPAYGALGAAFSAVGAHGFAAVVISLVYPPTRELGRMQLLALLTPRFILNSKDELADSS